MLVGLKQLFACFGKDKFLELSVTTAKVAIFDCIFIVLNLVYVVN